MSKEKPTKPQSLSKIEVGSSEQSRGLVVEYVENDGRPTLDLTVHHAKLCAEDIDSDNTVFSLYVSELAAFCASLLNLTPVYASSRYSMLGGYMLAMPSETLLLNNEGYTAHFLFFEDSTENLEKQNSYHKNEDLLLRDMSDSWNEIHNKSISTITISPSERAELTAFALRQLSNAWGVTVGDVLSILPKSFKAMP